MAASGVTAEVIAARGYWTATAADVEAVKHLGHSAETVEHGSALMLPVHDVHGAVAFTIARPDVPRLDARGKPKKYETPRGARLTLDVPPAVRPALRDSETRLWITEGQKKADAAVVAGAGCVIALTGVWAWKKHALAAWDAVMLRDRTVYLAFDSDAATNPKVLTALTRLRAFLGSRGAHVRIVHLIPGPDGAKVGLDDALAAGATLDLLARESTEHIRRVLTSADDKRPQLDVTVLHRPVILEAFRHVATAGVYRSGGHLVRVEDDDGALVLRPVNVPGLRAIIDRTVRCVRQGESGALPVLPPRDVAELMAHDPSPPVPPLRAVVSAPTFTADGRLLDQPGYDPASRLLVALSWTPRPAPECPTPEDLRAAREWWDTEALADFPFESAADRTAAVALAITPFVRDMIDGPTPLFPIDASTRGSGKGLLARTCLTPALGPRGCTIAALPKDEDETRKAITAYLAEGRLAVLFDNVAGRIVSAVLAKAVTESVWDDRTLGRSESVRYAVRCIWAVTVNNGQYSDEIGRRLVPIRLVPATDRPELREGFRHPELAAWVAAHRADLLWALAVFVRTWQAAGSPSPSVRPLGSFEAWTRVVGGILETAGYTDLLANRESILDSADPDTTTWQAFTAAWWGAFRDRLVPVRGLLTLAETHGVRVNGESERAQITSLGMALGARRDRFFGPHQLKQGQGMARREWRISLATSDTSDTYDTLYPSMQRVARAHARENPPRCEPGKKVAEVAEVSSVEPDPVARALRLVGEAEARIEREAIQTEAA